MLALRGLIDILVLFQPLCSLSLQTVDGDVRVTQGLLALGQGSPTLLLMASNRSPIIAVTVYVDQPIGKELCNLCFRQQVFLKYCFDALLRKGPKVV